MHRPAHAEPSASAVGTCEPDRLILTLKNRAGSSTMGPAPWFEFRGPEIFGPSETRALARFENGAWQYANEAWLQIECRTILSVLFTDHAHKRGPVIGPRPTFRIRDGYAFAGRECIAKLNTTGTWTRTLTKDVWRTLRIEPGKVVMH
jgi:hypothetical protein